MTVELTVILLFHSSMKHHVLSLSELILQQTTRPTLLRRRWGRERHTHRGRRVFAFTTMLNLLSGKRRWQRVMDIGGCEKRRRDEDEENITDRTRLLSAGNPNPKSIFRINPNPVLLSNLLPYPSPSDSVDFSNFAASSHVQDDAASPSLWKCDEAGLDGRNPEPWLSCAEVHENEFLSSSREEELAVVAISPLSKGKNCSNGSWRGFKQLVRKQFMPSLPFEKEAPEGMQHLRQKRIEGANDINRAPRVLGARKNMVELRRMDARSSFLTSSKKAKSKENLDVSHSRNSETSKAVQTSRQLKGPLKMEAQMIKKVCKENHILPPSQLKENAIFRKLKQRAKKDQALLLANSMD